MIDTTNDLPDTEKIKVRNLCDHMICYNITDGPRREFAPNQSIVVTAGELRQLNSEYGGNMLLRNYLQIQDSRLASEFGFDPSETPEYSWTKDDIDRVLLSEPIEVLEDALDFAPAGIVDLIITRAIAVELPDNRKREVILDMTGKNITKMIELNKAVDTSGDEHKPTRRRRVSTKK